MDYLPIFLDLKHKNVLIVGAGEVAFNKIQALLNAQAKIYIIAKKLCSSVKLLVKTSKIFWISKKFDPIYLNKVFLVIAATNDLDLNNTIFTLCKKRNLLVNVVDDQSKCSFIFPSIINRSPLIIALSSSGTAPVLLRLLREKIESMLPSKLGDVAALAGRWRRFIKKRYTSLIERRRFWEYLFNSIFVEHVLHGHTKKATSIIKKQINCHHPLKGEIILVGAGPGDADLLTLKGLQVLQKADVVLYDFLVSKEILNLVRRDAKCIFVGKKYGEQSISQDKIIELSIILAKQGKRVVRLKGGDPFIFGRGSEEIEAAKLEGIDFQVVPGITAAIGISAYTGIPLTHRKYAQGVIFITGHKCKNNILNNWLILCDPSYTLVVYMGLLNAVEISTQLMLHGRLKSTPIAIISQGTTLQQKVLIGRLEEIKKLIIQSTRPSLLIIGDVVLLHKQLSWF